MNKFWSVANEEACGANQSQMLIDEAKENCQVVLNPNVP
jgi:hypothetical protein